VHDWSRVNPNLFHDFHQTWTINIRNVLNDGLLPKGFSALVEPQNPDVAELDWLLVREECEVLAQVQHVSRHNRLFLDVSPYLPTRDSEKVV
jgi:hypothetical protein